MPRLATWFCLVVCQVGPARSDDLLRVYQDALANDARFTSAQAEYRAGLEALPLRRAGLLPRLSLEAQDSKMHHRQQYPNGEVETHRRALGYSVQLVQPVVRLRNWTLYRQGELQADLASSRFEAAQQDLLLRVAAAYFDVLHGQDSLRAISQLHLANSGQLASARKQFELGNVSVADVHEAQARFYRSRAQLIEAKTTLELARHALTRTTGTMPSANYRLRDGMAFTPPQPDRLEDWLVAARQNNPGVQVQELAQEVARQEVRGRQAEHLPTLDLVASQGIQEQAGASGLRRETKSVSLRLSVPLFEGGATSSAVREARNLLIKTEADLDDARRLAALETRRAWLGVIGGIAKVRALEAAERSSESALESSRLGYRLGMRVSLDVLDAQSQLADTRQQLSRARYDTLLAKLQLKAAGGALDIGDVHEVNGLLEYLPDDG